MAVLMANLTAEVAQLSDDYIAVVAERDALAAALKSIIEWTGDDHAKPPRSGFVIVDPNGWFERRLLMIRNAARAALQKINLA